MNVLSFLQSPWGEILGWMLVHSLWQIAMVAALHAAAMHWLRKRSADARYISGCVALAAMMLWPVATILSLPAVRPTLPTGTLTSGQTTASEPLPLSAVEAAGVEGAADFSDPFPIPNSQVFPESSVVGQVGSNWPGPAPRPGGNAISPNANSAQKTAAGEATPGVVVTPGRPTTLVGRILYDGPPPEPKKIDFSDPRNSADAALYRDRGLIDESLLVGEDRGLANVVVWATSKNLPVPPWGGPLPLSTLRFKNGRFEPHVLVFWKAALIKLANDDPTGHNVWWKAIHNPRNVTIASGEQLEFRIESAEPYPTPVTSMIHHWLQAYALPLDHPCFSVTGADGRFEVKHLPIGEWEFAIWHERTGWLQTDKFPTGRFKLKIEGGRNDLGDLRVDPATLAASDLPLEVTLALVEKSWSEGSAPRVAVGIRNRGSVPIQYRTPWIMWPVEIDGREYGWSPTSSQDLATLDPGESISRTMFLNSDWRERPDDRPAGWVDPPTFLKPTAGTHKLRISVPFLADAQAPDNWRRATSAPVEFLVTPAKPKPGGADRNEAAAGDVDRLDDQGFSQLHGAAAGGHVEQVIILVGRGANTDVKQAVFEGAPLQYAASNGHGITVQALLELGATVDSRDTAGRTPLIWAAQNGHADVVRRLLDAGADIHARNTAGFWTPLHFAISRRHQEVAQLLIDRGADVTATNFSGQTPLDLNQGLQLRIPPPANEPAEAPAADAKNEQPAQDSNNLERLLGDIRRILAPGWQAALAPGDVPADLMPPTRRWDTPHLFVWYEKEVPGRWWGPGIPMVGVGDEDAFPFQPTRIWISFELMQYLAPPEHQAKAAQNQQLERQRLEFERRLRGLRYAYKGNDPKPPSAYRPQTPQEAELVRQYALLWMQTEPQRLPTHFYRTLAMRLMFPDELELQDKALNDELRSVSDGLSKIITPYAEKDP